MKTPEFSEVVGRIAKDARAASRVVAKAPAKRRERALRAAANRVVADAGRILSANQADLDAAMSAGLSPALLDRLKLDRSRVEELARALEAIAAMPDPIGVVTRQWRRPNGLVVGQMRIPLGVIAMIYEARPNVTTDAFGLCLRAGNAVILRGGSEALRTNRALGDAIGAGLAEADLPPTAAQVVPVPDRALMLELLQRDAEIDLCIPRGGEGLIRFVTEHARMPVIQHYKGVCHVFVDASADLAMALQICENAKVQRPGVCNACETILVHEAVAAEFLPRLAARFAEHGVEIRGDAETQRICASQRGGAGDNIVAASEADWATEYLALIVSVRVVRSLDEAITHIETYGSHHTEAIVTRDYAASRRFVDEVDSSTVIVNASTRFADGGELGLGAEIGISTSKLHAFGPMGAEGLTTQKFVVFGDGQVRS